MNQWYRIDLHGCHDYTWVAIPLSPSDVAAMKALIQSIKEHSYSSCCPTMDMRLATQEDKDLFLSGKKW